MTDPKPIDILNLAQRDAMIKYHLLRWQKGELSWDQALMAMVMDLSVFLEEEKKDEIDHKT